MNAQARALRSDLEEVTALRTLQQSAAQTLQQGLTGVQEARTELSQAVADRTDLPKRFTEDPIRTAILISSTETLQGFASGLSQIDWTADAIEAHLHQRLPAGLRKLAPEMAQGLRIRFPGAAPPDARQIARGMSDLPTSEMVLRFVQKTGQTPDFLIGSARFRPIPAFADCGLPALETLDDLAGWLALPPPQLIRFSDLNGLSARMDNAFAPHYRHHLHPKRDGTLRLIEEPKPVLKTLQRRILHGMLTRVPPHDAAYGFRQGRNCAQAAARHAGEAMVIRFDLAAFFPSIAQHRVYGLFRGFGYPQTVARHLTGLCTALTPIPVLHTPGLAARDLLASRHLPQGAPTSPALANLIAFALDQRLAGLARRLGARFTRYADDLCFSGDAQITRPLLAAVPEIVRDTGFHLNPAKTRVQPAHHRQSVTGIVVNQHLNLPRRDYDRLKAEIHHLQNPQDTRRSDPAYLNALDGRIAWLEQLNPHKGAKLRARLAAALSGGA